MLRKKKKAEVVEADEADEAEVVEEVTVKEEKVVATVTNNTKPYFFPRLVAYIIDILLVSLICTSIMFLLPNSNNYDKYLDEYKQIQVDYAENKIDYEEYFNKTASVAYDVDYNNVFSIIIEAVLLILYFIVFQFYNKGQTFGKKLMRLRVVSTKDDDLSLNQVAYRALIINSILINILILAALLFLGRNYYYYASYSLQWIAAGIELVTLFMILFRKDGRGLHDVISGTKVIQEN